MNFYLIFKLFIILFISTINVLDIYADSSQDNYLWLEFDKEIKQIDGGVTQPLFIYYGQFPDKRRGLQELENNVEAIYTFGERDKRGNNIFYKLNIEKERDKSYIKVNSKKANLCILLVRGKKKNDGLEYNYIAKTSFFIFGNSNELEEKNIPIMIDKSEKQLDIKIYREHIKEGYPIKGYPIKGYIINRKGCFPLRIIVVFDKKPFGNEKITIVNEAGSIEQLKTDRSGNFVYVPKNGIDPSMKKEKGFEQDLIIASYIGKNAIYKSSYTVLFKFLPLEERSFNMGWGFAVFTLSAAITFIGIIMARRRQDYASL